MTVTYRAAASRRRRQHPRGAARSPQGHLLRDHPRHPRAGKPKAAVYVDLTPQPGELLPVIPAHLRTIGRDPEGRGPAWAPALAPGQVPRHPLPAVPRAGHRVVGRGRVRLAGTLLRWWWVTEQHGLRSQAAADGDSREWLRLHGEAKETRKVRGIILGGGLAVPPRRPRPWWRSRRGGRGAPRPRSRCRCWRGRAPGGQADHHARPTVTPRFRVLNADVVLRAYYAAGLGDPDKPGQQVTFGSPMAPRRRRHAACWSTCPTARA